MMTSPLKTARAECARWNAENEGWTATAGWDPDNRRDVLIHLQSPPLPTRAKGFEDVPWNLYEPISRAFADNCGPKGIGMVLDAAAKSARHMAGHWIACPECNTPREPDGHCGMCGGEPLQ